MKKLLIYGAGAIGRGYLPRVFTKDKYEYYFVETNPRIRELMNTQKGYTSYMTINDQYDICHVPVQRCFDDGEEIEILQQADAVLVAVGPRNFMKLQSKFMGTTMPILSFENDSSLPVIMRRATGNDNIVFAVPDVITSNMAPKEFAEKDPLSIVTEHGVCFIDSHVEALGGDCRYVSAEELHTQWMAKLYIHNTPHCIAAYLGNLINATYMHEAMKNESIASCINGVMIEMENMLVNKYGIDIEFLKYYSSKEIQRFSNTLLFDPIARVAREPFRKLAPNERLIGAAQLCLGTGVMPKHLMEGIMAAFCFENDSDPDFHIKQLMNALNPRDFLKIIIRLREGEALYEILLQNWKENLAFVNKIKNHV